MKGDRWYVLEVYDGDAASYWLPYDGFNIEDPTYRRFFLHNRTKAVSFRELRLFPSYLFIRLPAFGTADWRRVNSTTGVIGPLGLDGVPEPLGAGVTEQLVFEARMGMYDERLPALDQPKPKSQIVLKGFDRLKEFVSGVKPLRDTVAA